MTNKKNVLLVTQEFPPMIGGAGMVAWQNAKMLADAGHSVTVLTVKSGDTTPIGESFKVIGVPRISKLWVLPLLWRLLNLPLHAYDNIIINDIGAALVFALFFRNSTVVNKVLVYLHGGEVQSVFKRQSRLFKLVGFRKKYIDLLRCCQAIIAVSNYMKTYFLAQCPDVVEKEMIHVVYAGVDDVMFYPCKANLHVELGIPPERTLLVSVSRITEDKGYATMLDIFAEVITRDKYFHWIIIGDGPYLDELKEGVVKNNLSEYITFLGAVPRYELPRYYSGADLFWLLSERESESFGLVYIEAQACGVPVLGPRRYGVIEAVSEGKTGYLVDEPIESISIIIAREYLLINEEAAVSFAKRFYLARQVEKLEAIL